MLRHLIVRFFESLRFRPLDPAEQRACEELLRPEERALFWGQQAVDQRHGFESATISLAEAPERLDLARAALLHDVGKRHARLTTIGRVAASVARITRLPVRGRLRSYLDHAAVGAAELEHAGAEPLTVTFAALHHDKAVPEGIAPADWGLLRRADGE